MVAIASSSCGLSRAKRSPGTPPKLRQCQPSKRSLTAPHDEEKHRCVQTAGQSNEQRVQRHGAAADCSTKRRGLPAGREFAFEARSRQHSQPATPQMPRTGPRPAAARAADRAIANSARIANCPTGRQTSSAPKEQRSFSSNSTRDGRHSTREARRKEIEQPHRQASTPRYRPSPGRRAFRAATRSGDLLRGARERAAELNFRCSASIMAHRRRAATTCSSICRTRRSTA